MKFRKLISKIKRALSEFLCFFFLLCLIQHLVAAAGIEFPQNSRGKGSLVFNLENDVWLHRDDGYTNGIGFSWVSPELKEKSKSAWLRFLYRLNILFLGDELEEKTNKGSGAEEKRWATISLAQGMFTPADLSKKEIIPYDRPYAGLLYAGLNLVKNGESNQDSFGAALGTIGPASLAEAAQKWLHRTYGWVDPQGWENQLKNEPVFELWLSRFWTLTGRSSTDACSSWRPAVKVGLGGEVGNLMTDVEAVLDLKFGLNLQPQNEAFSPSPLFNQLIMASFSRTSIYVFCRLEGKGVLRNLLLDGNTFALSPKVKPDYFYGQITSGLVYCSSQASLSFYAVIRTKEFKGQRYFDPYCGLSLGFNF
ncbi:MAG: lipid A deacylase LpxR family protein [Candidatus Aminicenantes bacterium]|jgi:lipid A 3-O-deacylase|nr:lipid A deacylase LpxR family protein [Candidatus Aminicenantes bacterium]